MQVGPTQKGQHKSLVCCVAEGSLGKEEEKDEVVVAKRDIQVMAKATNKALIKIINKMSQEHTEGWAMHLLDALWAYRKSPKSATGFSPFSLVYRTEVVSPAEIMTPSLRLMQMREKEKEGEVFAAERFEDLEELDERREEA